MLKEANELMAVLVHCAATSERTVECLIELIEQALAEPSERTIGALRRVTRLYRESGVLLAT